jgi:hypothetical protein
MSALIAVNWEFELRGILTVIMGVAVLMGSVYLVLGTNLGARLGFLVTLTGLAGWMALMGGIWWMYGIGLKGDAPEWKPVPGRTVIQQVELLHESGVLRNPLDLSGVEGDSVGSSAVLEAQLEDEGWRRVAESAPEFGQAEAAAGVFLEEEDVFAAGDFDVTSVFEIGGEAYPKPLGDELDQIAFWHKPYYTLVEVAPFIPLREEPGRAPTIPEIDTSMQRQYVYMIRDLGSLREPAAYICIGSTIMFLALCGLLHRRDRFVTRNLERKALAAA